MAPTNPADSAASAWRMKRRIGGKWEGLGMGNDEKVVFSCCFFCGLKIMEGTWALGKSMEYDGIETPHGWKAFNHCSICAIWVRSAGLMDHRSYVQVQRSSSFRVLSWTGSVCWVLFAEFLFGALVDAWEKGWTLRMGFVGCFEVQFPA